MEGVGVDNIDGDGLNRHDCLYGRPVTDNLVIFDVLCFNREIVVVRKHRVDESSRWPV